MQILKICCDASQKTIAGRIFTCSGAISINSKQTKYEILSDSTNNRGELMAVYLACRLAYEESQCQKYDRINVYSDSQFVIYGLTRWMPAWIKSMETNIHHIMMGSSGGAVANQNMFLMILTYLWLNRLTIHFYNQKGHVNINKRESLEDANKQFYMANGFYLKPDELIELSNFNNFIDKATRDLLDLVDPNQYPIVYHSPGTVSPCRYIVPEDYMLYVRKGSEH